MNYAQKLKDPRWQAKRLKIFERDKWKCTLCCEQNKTLHVHHFRYTGNPWEAEDYDLQTLCFECHAIVEANKIADNTTNIPIKVWKEPTAKGLTRVYYLYMSTKLLVDMWIMKDGVVMDYGATVSYDMIKEIANHINHGKKND